MFKSYPLFTAGAVLAALLFGLKAQAGPAYDDAPAGEFSEQITFSVDGKANPVCIAPQTALLVAKRVPSKTTLLVLPEDSPYQSAVVVESDPLGNNNRVRHYTDRLVTKEGNTLILAGNIDKSKNTNDGTWQDSHGCQGKFVVQQRR